MKRKPRNISYGVIVVTIDGEVGLRDDKEGTLWQLVSMWQEKQILGV